MSPSKTKNEKKFLKVCEQKEKREREIFVLFEKKSGVTNWKRITCVEKSLAKKIKK